jgi:hypothetical protein
MESFGTPAPAKVFRLAVSIEIGGEQVPILLEITLIIYDTDQRHLHDGCGSFEVNLVSVVMIRGGTADGARLVPGADARQGSGLGW